MLGSPSGHDGRKNRTQTIADRSGEGAPVPTWAVASHINCYDGMGGKHIGEARIKDLVMEPDDEVATGSRPGPSGEGAKRRLARGLRECIRRCLANTEVRCTAVTVLARPKRRRERKHANCFYRSRVTPALCARDSRFDTYTAPASSLVS